jgi:hypothetical protein
MVVPRQHKGHSHHYSSVAALDILEGPVPLHVDPCDAAGAEAKIGGVKVVSIIVPGEIGFRGLVSRTLAAVCTMACPIHPESDVFRYELVSAVGEAFNNAVLHAYAFTRGDVCLTVSFDSVRIVVELVETGEAFDPEAVPELAGDEPQESGMGLFIIRRFVDELLYTPGPPNRLRMVKRLPKP